MSEPIETIEYRELEIEVHYDEWPESPREWDNLGTMVCFHSRYNLGDKHSLEVEDLKKLVEREDVIALPLFLYDHSGITMNTGGFSCQWDSGQVGYIYVELSTVREEWKVKRVSKQLREKVIQILKSEVETYDQFLRGEVYYYRVDGYGVDVVDDCGGFFGDEGKEYMIEEAKNSINYYLKDKARARQKKLKELIINSVPLDKRQELVEV